MTELSILFEDGEALVIDKPGGLPLDRPRAGGPCIEDSLHTLKLGFQRAPVPVHRLDHDTSGCLLLARNPSALRRFSAAFEARQVEKTYLGLVAGEVTGESGTIELALTKTSTEQDGWRMVPSLRGKPATTHWRRLMMRDGMTLVEFRPVTGRTHQIRVHALAGLGAPLLGDPTYGKADPRVPRTMLHAAALTVQRGAGKPPIVASASLPGDFARLGFAVQRA